MADVAHIIPRSPDDPPRRRSPVRPWHAAVALALVAAVSGGLWAWKPWQSVELPEHTCWGVLGRSDLEPLAGPDGKATEPEPSRRIATPASPGPLGTGDLDYRCYVSWGSGTTLLDVDVRPPKDGIDSYRQSDAVLGQVAPLDFGSGTTGWVLDNRNTPGGAVVRLYVPCDYEAPQGGSGQAAPSDLGVRVTGDVVHGASPAKAHQAYADIALKVGRAAMAAYECRNAVILPSTAPRVVS
ncbi:hypothetical protein [Kitasatospora sp. NPDC054795]